MLTVAFNHGFRISYCDNKEHAERCMASHQGVMFSDKLEEVAQQIARGWVHAAYNEDRRTRVDYYISEEHFAEVNRAVDRDLKVYDITFVAETPQGLERAVGHFNLPFNKDEIHTGH